MDRRELLGKMVAGAAAAVTGGLPDFSLPIEGKRETYPFWTIQHDDDAHTLSFGITHDDDLIKFFTIKESQQKLILPPGGYDPNPLVDYFAALYRNSLVRMKRPQVLALLNQYLDCPGSQALRTVFDKYEL